MESQIKDSTKGKTKIRKHKDIKTGKIRKEINTRRRKDKKGHLLEEKR